MLEIIALIFLTKNIGNLAIQKGNTPGMWKLYTVLCWIGGELLGIIIGYMIFGQEATIPAFICGYGCAVAGYFILKLILNKKPDAIDEISLIGQDIL